MRYSSSEKAEIILIGPINLSVAWEILVASIRTERAGPGAGSGRRPLTSTSARATLLE